MISQTEYKINNYYFYKDKSDKSSNANFFKNINLYILKSRLLIDANIKFCKFTSKFNVAWSNRFNEKAYVDRRRILGRDTSSSYK